MKIDLTKWQVENIARHYLTQAQAHQLQIDKHKLQYPGYLQDKVFLQQMQNAVNDFTDIHNVCAAAIWEGGK